MVKNYINFLQFLLVFIFLTVLSPKIYSQCAGNDAHVDLCTIEDPVNQNISLFSLLGGSPVPGGTWSGDDTSRGLNPVLGTLNAQLISQGGNYRYTYTVPAATGCTDNKATVTLTISAYAGVPAPHATVCSDEEFFNLFTAFNGTVMAPHTNGTWTNSTGQIVDQLIPIKGIGGTFQYTYTVPPVLACSPNSPSSTVIVTIRKAPEVGKARNLLLCAETDLASYTNLDLSTRLVGQDSGGEWRGPGLTSLSDNFVNLQEVYDAGGPGDYTYTYTVYAAPNNKVCPDKTEPIVITIEKRLDFTGAKIEVIKDICEPDISTATYSAVLTRGSQPIPNGQYRVTFNVSGPNGGTQTITANFVNGVLNFPISSSYFRQVGEFKISIINIVNVSSNGACNNIVNDLSDELEVHPIPRLDGAVLTLEPTCQNKNALADLTNALLLPDGNYDIVYNVTGDNFALGQRQNITISGGKSNFTIPGNLNANSGASTITIINITNTATGCTNTANIKGNLIINPLPNAATVRVAVNDRCLHDPVSVAISGLGTLTDVTISYMLSDSNLSTSETVVLPVTGGKTEFQIPTDLVLNTGSTVISITNLKNNITNCDVNLNNVFDGFIINPIPAAPVVNPQPFCKVDEATIANLFPKGPQYKWYNTAASTTALPDTTILESGNYYVKETSAAGCTSEPAMVLVTINDTPSPILNTDGADFCGLNNPTIADLSNNTDVPSTVVWYDAEANGNLLSPSTPLIEQGKYYGFNFPASDCFSSEHIEVTVRLTDCDDVPNDFFIPDGFSPNGDGVNDSFVIKDIEFLYPNYTLEIFNRYGNGMYKGDKSKPAWDGINYEKSGIAGGVAPNGVYFYVLHFNKDNKPPKQGRLYLNR